MRDFNPQTKPQTLSTTESGKQEKRKIKIPLLPVLKFLVTVATLVLMIYSLIHLPAYFSKPVVAKAISIEGVRVLSKASVIDTLALNKNTPWLDIDPYELSRRLVANPWIEKAVVHRRHNLGIDVAIVETKPTFYLKTRDGIFLFSKDYRVLNMIHADLNWNLPVLVNNQLSGVKPGTIIPQQEINKAFEVISLLENHPTLPLSTVSEIDISDPLNIELVTISDAIRIKLGSDNFQEKLLNLQDALPTLAREKGNIRYIDLRYKSAVVFRRRV